MMGNLPIYAVVFAAAFILGSEFRGCIDRRRSNSRCVPSRKEQR